MRNRFVPALALAFLLGMGRGGLLAQAPTPDDNPTGNTGALKAQIQTGGSYDAHSGNGTRIVNDLHVPGALGVYGLDFTRYWNSLRNDSTNPYAEWPMDFGASGWSHSWRWSAISGEDTEEIGGDGGNEIYKTSITVTFPDGHASKYSIIRSKYPFWQQTWPADPRFGPPYIPEHFETNHWTLPGSIHDRLCDMAEDGSNFWLHLADGGSVHFVGELPPDMSSGHARWSYLATEVFDPHGFRTDLTYNHGYLTQVKQEGERWLTITWGTLDDWPVITRVDTGGNAGSQHVTYGYKAFPNQQNCTAYVLALATYEDEPAPGQSVSAFYNYGTCFGFGPEPCVQPPYATPMLKSADDPHYAGPMTVIHYNYLGPCGMPPGSPNPLYFCDPYGIVSEIGDMHAQFPVSSFALYPSTGTRMETNGFGATRMFYFGSSAGSPPAFGARPYQLAKLTDFYYGAGNAPFEHQTFDQGQPYEVWDGRGIMTRFVVTPWNSVTGEEGDDSGMPSEIDHLVDGSTELYDRIDSSSSETPDTSRIRNTHHHWLFKKKEERDQWTIYKRDARRRVKEIDYPGISESFGYDNSSPNTLNQVTSHTLPSGAVVTYEYDAKHQLVAEYDSVDPSGDRKEYLYDGLGRVEKMKDARALHDGADYTVKMEYNGRHQVTKVHYRGSSDPMVTYEYDRYGNCTAIIDELGHRKDYTYDTYRRCTSYTEQLGANCTNVTWRRWDWIYDRVIESGTQNPPQFLGQFGASSHTSKEWRVQIEPVFDAANQRRITARWFDANNRITLEQTGWIQSGSGNWYAGPDVETHRFTYDQNGQKSSYTDPLGRVTNYVYDDRNRLWTSTEQPAPGSNIPPRTTETHYNKAGNKTLVIFPDGKTQEWPDADYDAFGQPGHFIDERHNHTYLYYRWGPMKKLASVLTHRGTEPQLTTFWQDGMGRLTETIFPDTTFQPTFERTTYEFGQPKTFWTRRGQIKTMSYDARGREYFHTWENGAAPDVTCVWDDANRLINISNVFSTIDYGYDYAGQAKWEGNTIAGANGRTQITYCRYPSGEVSQVTYSDDTPSELVVQRAYTARGQLQSTGWSGGHVDYTYLPDGKVDYEDYGNGVRSDLDYDGRGFINLTRTYRQSSTYSKRDYWRDERDRITAWRRGNDDSANPMEDLRGDRYQYDDEGQLEIADYRALIDPDTQVATDPKRRDHFNYDELGNRVGSNEVASRGSANFGVRGNGLNQYASWENSPGPNHWGSPLYYDDNFGSPPAPSPTPPWIPPGNGVTMADGYIAASFNALNQPVAMWSPVIGSPNFMWFGYDPLGRCVKRWMAPLGANNQSPPINSNPATYLYYDGWNLVQEGPSASAVDRAYVHGNRVDEIVASQVGGVWYYHHYDARGHCILLTNASGGLQEQYDYDAFGFPRFYTAGGMKLVTPHTRFLFTGREWLSDLRIYDFRARQYQPELGRFLQPDPKEFAAGDYNLYRYCHNDPVNKSDPFGLYESPAWLQALIPGQTEWDAAITEFQNGNYGYAGAHALAMLGEQYLYVRTLGTSRLIAPSRTVVSTVAKNTVVQEVGLAGRIAESGMSPAGAGKFFGWGNREITKPLSSFTRESLQAAGWNKERLVNVAKGYERLAKETANPSAPGRAEQLRDLAKLF